MKKIVIFLAFFFLAQSVSYGEVDSKSLADEFTAMAREAYTLSNDGYNLLHEYHDTYMAMKGYTPEKSDLQTCEEELSSNREILGALYCMLNMEAEHLSAGQLNAESLEFLKRYASSSQTVLVNSMATMEEYEYQSMGEEVDGMAAKCKVYYEKATELLSRIIAACEK